MIEDIFEGIRNGRISLEEFKVFLLELPYKKVCSSLYDVHRELRTGIPEVIFGYGKDIRDIVCLVEEALEKSGKAFVTRLDEKGGKMLRERFENGFYNPTAMTFRVGRCDELKEGLTVIVSAGSSDRFVVEEAKETLIFLGSRFEVIEDVGVAGIHRLFDHIPLLRSASSIIVVCGMEGALASVVTGLVDRPVIGVPTSVGYGSSLGGLSALLTMANSCSPGLSIVNVDNGFGAACAAHRINLVLSKWNS